MKTVFYQLSGNKAVNDMESMLNQILASISDRLDKLEGNRGNSTIQDSLTIESIAGDILHGINTLDEI